MSDRIRASFDVDMGRFAKRLFVASVVCELIFLVLDYHVHYARLIESAAIRRMVNLTREDGLPSWFAVTQTLCVALVLFAVAAAARASGASRFRTRAWTALGVFFFYMSIDDGSKFHERIGSTFGRLFKSKEGDADSGGLITSLFDANPSYNWQLVFVPALSVCGLLLLAFLWRELGTNRRRAVLLLSLGLLGSAVLMDFAEGLDEDHPRNPYVWIADTLEIEEFTEARFSKSGYDTLMHFSKAIEETFEMFAMTMLLQLFLWQAIRFAPEWRLTLDTGE